MCSHWLMSWLVVPCLGTPLPRLVLTPLLPTPFFFTPFAPLSPHTPPPSSSSSLLPFLFKSRLAVNSVIVGDFQRPFAIAELLTNISSGFRLLNLKNDALRKRFDGLKYDVSKVEEVVYDLTVRGLKQQSGEKRPSS